jgi:CheY-like chemotaxis protein
MKLLLVEDNLNLRDAFREWVELQDELPIDLLLAENGLKALQVLQEQSVPPDVIVSDYFMPEMDGLAFLEALRQDPRWLHIPFFFLTASGDFSHLRRGKQFGVEEFISKPFAMNKLLHKVHARFLGSHRGYQTAS